MPNKIIKLFITKLITIDKQNHYSFCPPLFFSIFVCFFTFLFHLLFWLSLTLIIGIFYCLNYTLLWLHLFMTHLVSHLSLSSIVFIISTLVITIFYCLSYTSLLLHLFITQLVINFIITKQLSFVLDNWFMIYINITNLALISSLEKDHSLIEMRHLKNAVIFIQTLRFIF